MNKWIFMLLLLCTNAAASDLRLTLNVASRHFTAPPMNIGGYNERNPGLGLEFQVTDKFYIHGGYLDENSHGQKGRYLGIGRSIFQYKHISAGLEYTIADGY